MPRLTDHTYLATYNQLHSLWLSDSTQFFLLSPNEQWALHDYFQLNEKLSAGVMLEYRRPISKRDASLPQRAGRALSHLRRIAPVLESYRQEQLVAPPPKKHQRTKPGILVFSELHAELDKVRLAKAFLQAFEDYDRAMEESAKKRSGNGDT